MSKQIYITREALEAHGWMCEVVDTLEEDYDWVTGESTGTTVRELKITKGEYIFWSYLADEFCAACNEWGSNIRRFREAGLFDIPHVLG